DELRRLADSINIRAQHPGTLVSLARALQRAKHPDSALRLLRDAQSVYPGDFAFAHSNLGNVLVNQNRLDEAIDSYKRAIELEPNFASAHRGLGNALRLQKKLDEAVACGKTAVELDPKDALAWLLLHAAVRELRDQTKWDEAITWIR